MNDTLRMLLMNLVAVVIAFAAAFGFNLTQEQAAAVVGLAAVLINLVAYFWKTGQEGPMMGLVLAAFVMAALLGLHTGTALADWSWGPGGVPIGGGDPGGFGSCYTWWCF